MFTSQHVERLQLYPHVNSFDVVILIPNGCQFFFKKIAQ